MFCRLQDTTGPGPGSAPCPPCPGPPTRPRPGASGSGWRRRRRRPRRGRASARVLNPRLLRRRRPPPLGRALSAASTPPSPTPLPRLKREPPAARRRRHSPPCGPRPPRTPGNSERTTPPCGRGSRRRPSPPGRARPPSPPPGCPDAQQPAEAPPTALPSRSSPFKKKKKKTSSTWKTGLFPRQSYLDQGRRPRPSAPPRLPPSQRWRWSLPLRPSRGRGGRGARRLTREEGCGTPVPGSLFSRVVRFPSRTRDDRGWCGEGKIQIPTLRGPEREVPVWEAGCLPPAGPASILPLRPGTRLKGDPPVLPPARGIPALRCPEPALAQAFSLLLSLRGRFGGRVSGTGGEH